MKKLISLLFGLTIIISLYLYVFKQQATSLTLFFTPYLDKQKIEFNGSSIATIFGNLKLTNLKFYISNIRIISNNHQDFKELNSYHLVQFGKPFSSQIQLTHIPKQSYKKIEFIIGVDKKANKGLEMKGDLNPNNAMAWNWKVGYKFFVLEGKIFKSNQWQPLVYHIGFNKNARKIVLNLPDNIAENPILNIDLNLMTLFVGDHQINPNNTSSIKFSKQLASKMADNYQLMFSKSIINSPYIKQIF